LEYGAKLPRKPRVPPEEMKTNVFAPAAFAALAISMFRSWSIFHWLATPPAAARVVPTAEKTVCGGGAREGSLAAQVAVSVSMRAVRLEGEEAAGFGARREIVVVWRVGAARRAGRMQPPTRPVLPKTMMTSSQYISLAYSEVGGGHAEAAEDGTAYRQRWRRGRRTLWSSRRVGNSSMRGLCWRRREDQGSCLGGDKCRFRAMACFIAGGAESWLASALYE
jgi:hypothetical protein